MLVENNEEKNSLTDIIHLLNIILIVGYGGKIGGLLRVEPKS